jgi:hypothetical protein
MTIRFIDIPLAAFWSSHLLPQLQILEFLMSEANKLLAKSVAVNALA